MKDEKRILDVINKVLAILEYKIDDIDGNPDCIMCYPIAQEIRADQAVMLKEEVITKKEAIDAIDIYAMARIEDLKQYFEALNDFKNNGEFDIRKYKEQARELLNKISVRYKSLFSTTDSEKSKKIQYKLFNDFLSVTMDRTIQLLFDLSNTKDKFIKHNVDTKKIDTQLILLIKLIKGNVSLSKHIKPVILECLLNMDDNYRLDKVKKYRKSEYEFPSSLAVKFVCDCMSKDELVDYINKCGCILQKKDFIAGIVESGKMFESMEDFYSCIDPQVMIEQVFNDNSSIDILLQSEITEEQILETVIDKKGKPKYHCKKTEQVWELFEKGKLSVDGLKAMARAKYFSTSKLIDLYNERNNRKIASELGEAQVISEEKLIEYFSPSTILRQFSKGIDAKYVPFYKETIQKIYKSHGQDLDVALVEEIKDKCGDDKKSVEIQIMKLYSDGYIRADAIQYAGISENDMLKGGLVDVNDTSKLIYMFNDGLISQEFMLESFDEEQIMDMISKGMSSRVLAGFYTTAQLIDFATPKENPETNELIPAKLTMDNLRELKDDIVIGINGSEVVKSTDGSSSLLDLYTDELLDYDGLIELANAGVIRMEDATAINDRYNLEKDWENLKQQGIIGNPINGLLGSLGTGNGAPLIIPQGGTVGIDEMCIWDLYIALGATEYMDIDKNQCPVFKDYIVIPLLDKKIAYLEGKDGRTYIVPLKIVMEQLHNPNGRLDLMGNAARRNDFNSNKDYIRSVNHTRNWGLNLIKKTADLPIPPYGAEEADDMIKNNPQIRAAIEACSQSYDYRKTHR